MTLPSPWDHSTLVVRHHYYERKPGFEMAADTYEEWAAFAVEEGEFDYRIGGAAGRACADEVVVCPPGIKFHRHTNRPITFHYFLFHWIGSGGEAVAERNYAQPSHLRFSAADRLRSSLSSIRTPAFARHSAYRLWRNHVLLDLFRLHAMEQLVPAAPERLEAQDPRMEEARRMLEDACDAPLSMSAVAERCGMTAVQFTRRFRQTYGVNPSAYVESLRLDKACHLLTHTSLTIEQVALACGYSNGFYFSRVFVSRLRMPPSEYRNQYRV